MGEKVLLAVVAYGLLLAPGAALAATWLETARRSIVWGPFERFALWVATASYVFLWLCLWQRRIFLGSDYSDRLFITIEINACLSGIACACAILRKEC